MEHLVIELQFRYSNGRQDEQDFQECQNVLNLLIEGVRTLVGGCEGDTGA